MEYTITKKYKRTYVIPTGYSDTSLLNVFYAVGSSNDHMWKVFRNGSVYVAFGGNLEKAIAVLNSFNGK